MVLGNSDIVRVEASCETKTGEIAETWKGTVFTGASADRKKTQGNTKYGYQNIIHGRGEGIGNGTQKRKMDLAPRKWLEDFYFPRGEREGDMTREQ